MNEINMVFSVLLSTFGIILLIVLIILGIRLIQVLNKVDRLVDDVVDKVNMFNGFFKFIDNTSGLFTVFVDKIISSGYSLFSKVFNKKNKEDDKDEKERVR